MDSHTAARIFHDWGVSEGLVDEPAANVKTTPPDMAIIAPVTDKGKLLLRQKRIRAVGFDPSEGRIVVFTKRAAPASKKQLQALPSRVDNVDIQYRQGAPNPIGQASSIPQGSPPYLVRIVGTSPHYACGSSISVGNNREAGTLGCLVRDAAGDLYGLTNNHISGGCSYAGVGLPIVAPGIFDVAPGSLNPMTIGHHHAALPLVAGSPDNVDPKANFDAAVFKVFDEAMVSSYQRDTYDTPTALGPLTPGLAVEKVGRTTGHTTGKVISQIFGANHIQYQAPLYGFSGPVFFDPLFAIAGDTVLFSDQGDSGSLITAQSANGSRIAVGIVVGSMNDGSAPGGKTTLALAIEPILHALGMSLVGGHNV